MDMNWLARYTLPGAFSLLPSKMDTPEARALVLAICAEESALKHRRQIRGPALGIAQFERIAVTDALQHPMKRPHLLSALAEQIYTGISDIDLHSIIEHNDTLALVLARLNLWPDPRPLPTESQADAAYAYYLRVWRPGKTSPASWQANWLSAWSAA